MMTDIVNRSLSRSVPGATADCNTDTKQSIACIYKSGKSQDHKTKLASRSSDG